MTNSMLNSSLTSLGDYAFLNCTSMEGWLTIPKAITYIPEGVYKGCTGIESVSFHADLKEIGVRFF